MNVQLCHSCGHRRVTITGDRYPDGRVRFQCGNCGRAEPGRVPKGWEQAGTAIADATASPAPSEGAGPIADGPPDQPRKRTIKQAVAESMKIRMVLKDGDTVPASPDTIIAVVCEMLGVTHGELSGGGRVKETVLARMIVTYQLQRRRDMSFPTIAAWLVRSVKSGHTTFVTALARLLRHLDDPIEKHLRDGELAKRWKGLKVRDVVAMSDVGIEAATARERRELERRLTPPISAGKVGA